MTFRNTVLAMAMIAVGASQVTAEDWPHSYSRAVAAWPCRMCP